MLLRTLGISLTVLTQGTMPMFDSHEFMALFKQLIESDLDEDMQQISRFYFQHPESLTRAKLPFDAALVEMLHNVSLIHDDVQENAVFPRGFDEDNFIMLFQAHELANSHLYQSHSIIHQLPQDLRLSFLQLYRNIQPRLIKDLA